jgi:threonine dehydrogenase-like Zn-dependent dehydrogenase
MRATCWMGRNKVEVQTVPDPRLVNSRDAIVEITSTAICGSDLHLYDGYIPTMQKGDVLGHEFMGEVVEVGRGVSNLAVGDRVVVPFPIACGAAAPASAGCTPLRELQPQRRHRREADGPLAGRDLRLLAHARRLRRRPGRVRARAVRRRRPDQDRADLTDEQVLFLSDIFPTGYMGAEMARSAGRHGRGLGRRPGRHAGRRQRGPARAARVIVVDRFDYRLRLAAERPARRRSTTPRSTCSTRSTR